MGDIVYLATPYTGQEEAAFEDVTRYAARLMGFGYVVFSPITHSHMVASFGSLPTEWDYWEKVDREFIEASSKLIVYMREGWQDSVGVTAEIEMAKSIGIPIEYHSAVDWELWLSASQ